MNHSDILSGILTGFTSSLIFNPLDKIIYISTTKNISITDKRIYSNLFQGSLNTLLTRIITSGIYFSMIDSSSHKMNPMQLSLLGASICSLTNPLQLIKFNSWYNNISMNGSYKMIMNRFGIRGLFIGTPAIFTRDLIFNYIYISNKKSGEHLHNIGIISMALMISSPINLIKNKKYGNFEDIRTIIKNFNYKQLGIGKNIIRSSLCFYFNQFLYDNLKTYL